MLYFRFPSYLQPLQQALSEGLSAELTDNPDEAKAWIVAPECLYQGPVPPSPEEDPTLQWIRQLPQSGRKLEKLIFLSSEAVYGYGTYHCGDCGPIDRPSRNPDLLGRFRWEVFCPICKDMLMPQVIGEDAPQVPTDSRGERLVQYEETLAKLHLQVPFPIIRLRLFSPYWGHPGFLERPLNVVGVFARQLLEEKPLTIHEDGYQMRDFTHLADVTQLLQKILADPNLYHDVYNVGSGQYLVIQQLAAYLQDFLNKPQVEYEISEAYRPGDIRHRMADISKARQHFGYEPIYEPIPGLAEFSQHLLQAVPLH